MGGERERQREEEEWGNKEEKGSGLVGYLGWESEVEAWR